VPTLSIIEPTKLSDTLGRALAAADVNQLGRDTGQATRLRTVTPHRLFLAMVSTLGSGRVESLADLLRAFNHQNGVEVACKAFYNARRHWHGAGDYSRASRRRSVPGIVTAHPCCPVRDARTLRHRSPAAALAKTGRAPFHAAPR
jgi:hypothetical protein